MHSSGRFRLRVYENVRRPTMIQRETAALIWNSRIFTKDTGSLRYIYDRGLTFFSGEGANRRAVRSIGTLQDITALKEKEREFSKPPTGNWRNLPTLRRMT